MILKKSNENLKIKNYFSGWYLFASVLFALALMVMSKIHYIGSVWGGLKENYLDPFGVPLDLLFVLVVPLCYVVLCIIDRLLAIPMKTAGKTFVSGKAPSRPFGGKSGSWDRKKFILIVSVIIFAAWLPYYLSYYPGGIYSDTFSSISMALAGNLRNNHHPVFYTFLIQTAIKIGNHLGWDLNRTLGGFLAVQMLVMEATIVYFGIWMIKHKINKAWIAVSLVYLIFFPLIPLNAISVWKDTPFCIAMFWYVLCLIDLYLARKKGQMDVKLAVLFGLLSILVAFTRNNGIYILIGTAIMYVILTIRDYADKRNRKVTYFAIGFSILVIVLIQGPVYRRIGVVQTEFEENLGVPIQQIARVVALDGNISKAQLEELDKLMPHEKIKERYVPCLVDSIKWSSDFDSSYLAGHKKEFFTLWFQLLKQNPGIYIEAYIMNTAGYWCVNVAGFDAYVQNYVWSNGIGVVQTDYFAKWTGHSFQNIANPKHAVSSAIFFWMMFFSMIVVIRNFGFKKSVLYMPLFLVWFTIMIATPIAVSMRYAFAIVFMAPLFFVLPCICINEERIREEK